MAVMDILRLARPFSREELNMLDFLEACLDRESFKQTKKFLKQNKISLFYTRIGVSDSLVSEQEYVQLRLRQGVPGLKSFVEKTNKKIERNAYEKAFKLFSKKAHELIPTLIAPNIIGADLIKKAAALQLFVDDPIHILLLGDPGTGKTDIIRSSSELHSISSFGLGSGTSSAGLSMTIKGGRIIKGLLPLAHNGICAIDELNLMRPTDRASLYNAMEKGFITYDKADHHHRLDANVKIIATANPSGEQFVGRTVEVLKKQIPFDAAMLSRFHLVFMMRKPDREKFMRITNKILEGRQKKVSRNDKDFVKRYVDYAGSLEVEIPSEIKTAISDFVNHLKSSEKEFLVEVSPRLVHGIMRLVRASARMNLREKANINDLETVQDIVKESLFVRKS